MASAPASDEPPLACGNCGQPMRLLALAGHYGQRVEIDLCPPCHLVWFDAVESARLAGPGLLALIGEMAAAQALAHLPARPGMACPRCRGALRQVHNRTRWGRSIQLECGQRHGAWQSFAQFLGERGLLRPMSSADRQRAVRRDGTLHCVNCGGAVGASDAACPWCQSVPSLVDVARLARALDPEAATAGHAVHDTRTAQSALQCAACGAAQPEAGGWQCTHCGATLAAPALAEAHQRVSELGPALQAHAERPSPHIVRQRLQAQEPGLQRQRERIVELQAEAQAQGGGPVPLGRTDSHDGPGGLQARLPRWAAWALAAGLLLWWWF